MTSSHRERTLAQLLDEFSAGTGVPGGGTAAALVGSIGASLVAMVGNLTVGREKYKTVEGEMREVVDASLAGRNQLVDLAKRDEDAFLSVMEAIKLPKGTDDEKARRRSAIQEALKDAAAAPLQTMRESVKVMNLAYTAANDGNPNAATDALVGFLLAEAAFRGAMLNVTVNLKSIDDERFRQSAIEQVNALRGEQEALRRGIDTVARGVLDILG